jgi:hypothetical protein
MKTFVMPFSVAVVLMLSSSALAQGVVAYMPVAPAPVAYYQPAPVVGYGPVVRTAYYAPAPYYVASPVAVPYAAAPVVTAYYGGPVAVAPLYYGRPVIVRPKIYIPGQPVRNVVRAVTP